ncbi:MAG TPA: bifunctional phosphoribosylaminoimidazolecarboxamide formyltransferase/IMP cyclohydrolase [Vicinamibacterales bacterium]|nr:bifunctional phosphoribosylaminoimidazolecarboxamide formyltransferase/IMP cyclohydrolase [Vicinamibacterales bacterium]
MPRALLSVSDKTGLLELARGLAARGFELVSTGGTARALSAAGLAVTGVSDVTGFPEMMDGRVKTLHPAVHAGILARRERRDDLDAIARLGIQPIDVVAVNLYPFAQTAAKAGVAFDDLVEQIDIGGPSLVRAAAKNFRDVLVLVRPSDYTRALEAIDRGPSLGFRHELMVTAFTHTAEYDATIAAELRRVDVEGGRIARSITAAPDVPPASGLADAFELSMSKIRDLRYGENPHQIAAWYVEASAAPGVERAGLGDAAVLQGKELSYTNLLDLDAAARIVLEFSEPAAAVIKHTNPCGAAIGGSIAEAYQRARDADSLAAFGGIVGLSQAIDVPTAEAIVSTFIEAVIAPGVEDAARPILARKARMRVVTARFEALKGFSTELRSILGALLVQQRDRVIEADRPWTPDALPEGVRVVTRRAPTAAEWQALRFAWRICAHVKSNAVIFTDAQRTLAVGAGQMSRVDAVNVAVMKAGRERLAGSVAASDAYFPFRDGLDAVAAAGATAVVQPGGSIRDEESIAAANEHGVAMVFTGRRHFRH